MGSECTSAAPPLPTVLGARRACAACVRVSGERVDERSERIVLNGLLDAGLEKLLRERRGLVLPVLENRAQLIQRSRKICRRRRRNS